MADSVQPRRGFTISIFLPGGAPDGIRLIEKTNWTGKAIGCTRGQYPDVRKLPELNKPGVYVLYGPGTDPGRSRVYVGEGDVPKARIDQHLKDKDWWENVIVFTSKDENLNKAHIRFIEARLIAAAGAAKRSEVNNGTSPPSPHLSAQEAAFADTFCDEMLLIYPVLGVDAFEPIRAAQPGAVLHLKGAGGALARGARTGDKFAVYAGSIARASVTNTIPAGYDALREALTSDGVLVPQGAGLVLAEDYVFNSPTAAAAVLLGRSANGLEEWKTAGGASLKTIEAEATGAD